MKSSRRQPGRVGRLLFFLPIVVLGGIVAFLAISAAFTPSTGTLVAEMKLQPYSGSPILQLGTLSVDGVVYQSPTNISLSAGPHRVLFPNMNWYYTPNPESVDVFVGQTAFAIGVYHPISEVIAVSPTVFNNTKAIALHGVTPVVWINTSNQLVTLQGPQFNSTALGPGQSFTFVYPISGTYSFAVLGNPDVSGQVKVS